MFRTTKNWLRAGLVVAVVSTTLAGCDFLDFTEVNNPSTTIEDLAESENPTAAMLPGLRAQFARALDPTDPEVISDNYQIRGTGINKVLDEPRNITPDLINARTYDNVQELRALADFVIDVIIPEDTTVVALQRQEAHYYRAMAYLLLAEQFVAVPIEVDGPPQTSAALAQLAVTEFQTARDLVADGEFYWASTAALARAHHFLGNSSGAATEANAILNYDPEYVFSQGYDPSSVQNGPYLFLYLRTIKEMQPLPRLDFLDPKYTAREAPIYVSKAEEMHLILAEAEFAASNWAAGRDELALAVELANSREVEPFDDDDPRLNDDLTERPHDASIVVRADASSLYRAGLVLTRPGVVITPTVAATSLDADSIRAIAPAEQESLLHALFLARQEMMMLEGRRLVDLGIKLPMNQDEIETNPNINAGDQGTVVFVPSFIPPTSEMDFFTPASPYDVDGNLVETEITCLHDMNRILAQQWSGFGPVAAPGR